MELAKFLNQNGTPIINSILSPSYSLSDHKSTIKCQKQKEIPQDRTPLDRTLIIQSNKPVYCERSTLHRTIGSSQHNCSAHSSGSHPSHIFSDFLRKGASTKYQTTHRITNPKVRDNLKRQRFTEKPHFKKSQCPSPTVEKKRHPICQMFKIKCDQAKCKLDCFNTEFEKFLKQADLCILKKLDQITGREDGVQAKFKAAFFGILQKANWPKARSCDLDSSIKQLLRRSIPEKEQHYFRCWIKKFQEIERQRKDKESIQGKSQAVQLIKKEQSKMPQVQTKDLNKLELNRRIKRINSNTLNPRKQMKILTEQQKDFSSWKNKNYRAFQKPRILRTNVEKNRSKLTKMNFNKENGFRIELSNLENQNQKNLTDDSKFSQFSNLSKQKQQKFNQTNQNQSQIQIQSIESSTSFMSLNEREKEDPLDNLEENSTKIHNFRHFEHYIKKQIRKEVKLKKKGKKIRKSSLHSSPRRSFVDLLEDEEQKKSMNSCQKLSNHSIYSKKRFTQKNTIFKHPRLKKRQNLLRRVQKDRLSHFGHLRGAVQDKEVEKMIEEISQNYFAIEEAEEILKKHNQRGSILLPEDSTLTFYRKMRSLKTMIKSGFFGEDTASVQKYLKIFSTYRRIREQDRNQLKQSCLNSTVIGSVFLNFLLKEDSELKFYHLHDEKDQGQGNQIGSEGIIDHHDPFHQTNRIFLKNFESFVTEKERKPFDFIHYSNLIESLIKQKNEKADRGPQKLKRNRLLFQKELPQKIFLQTTYASCL